MMRFGRAGSGSDFDTDQSRSVYLVPRFCNFDQARAANPNEIVHGVNVLRGKGCTRMRLSCSCSFQGALFMTLVTWRILT